MRKTPFCGRITWQGLLALSNWNASIEWGVSLQQGPGALDTREVRHWDVVGYTLQNTQKTQESCLTYFLIILLLHLSHAPMGGETPFSGCLSAITHNEFLMAFSLRPGNGNGLTVNVPWLLMISSPLGTEKSYVERKLTRSNHVIKWYSFEPLTLTKT